MCIKIGVILFLFYYLKFKCYNTHVDVKNMDLKEMELYAKKENIPIMEKDGIEFLTKYIKENKVKSILEIGSAIGYSAIKMALIDNDITITTIERDEKRYNQAIEKIKYYKLEDRINIILGDALEENISGIYDLIFIDAAKAQSIKFFERYENLLKKDGTIITDNINFHGLTFSDNPAPSRNLRQLVRKIKAYLEFLDKNEKYISKYKNVGDGLMISKRND